jgi:lysophospholipase L1-like esterase
MRGLLLNAAVLLVSLIAGLVGAEVGVRLFSGGGTLTEFRNYVADQEQWEGRWRTMRPDPHLGYIPRDGYRGDDHGYNIHMTFGADGMRLHHQGKPPAKTTPPILVVGDSYAMGAEVEDDASWPAFLQATLERRVLNAGVPGYGIDQVVLRAEALVARYTPETLIVGLIADDIERARMRILWGLQKPYFEIENGALVLRNVPLAEPELDPRLDPLRAVLGYSYLMDVVMRRLGYMAWWRRGQPSHVEPAHEHGEQVACLLMDRLAALRDRHALKIVLVAQYSPQAWEAEHFRRKEVAVVRAVADCARARGIDTIDSYAAVAAAVRARGIAGSYTGIHMNPAGNRLTADLILDWLKAHP